MSQEDAKKSELVQAAQVEQSIDLNSLIPLGVQLIENSNKQAQAQIKLQRDNLEFSKQKLNIDKSMFTHKFWLLVFIAAAVVGISAGLIFIKDDVKSGFAILSHVGAIVVGIIAGVGWEKMHSK